jgi:hypothetical protein
VRVAIRLLVLVTAVALVACGGDDPVPVAQRFPSAEDAPGSKPDPVEERQEFAELDGFVAGLREALVDPDLDEMRTVFEDAGFESAGLDVRFFAETHELTAPHLFSWFIELESDDGAGSVLDWLEAETVKPCPGSCATKVTGFDVDGIPDARGIHRIATAEDIEVKGTENEEPHEGYWVAFTAGPIVYTVELLGPPGSVTQEQALSVANALHDRLTGD